MLTTRFESLFTGLTRAFVRYDDSPRTPGQLEALTAAWLDLDDHRVAIREEVESMGIATTHRAAAPIENIDSTLLFQVSHLAP